MPSSKNAYQANARIFDELINILYRQANPIFFGNIAVAVLSVYLLWDQLDRSLLLMWAGAIFALTAIRMIVVKRDLATSHAVEQATRRGRKYAMLAGLSGCLWGSIGILFFSPDNTVVTVFICIVLAGMTGGSVASQSSFLPSYYAFSLPTVLPFALRSFAHGDALFSILGVLSLFLLGVNLAYSRNLQRTVRESVALRFENTELIAQLRQEKERAESASRSKSQFLAAASHDLRQPTHALGLYIATLRSLCSAPTVRADEVGGVANKLQNALKGLVQLLDISKLDAGVVKVKQEIFDVQEVLETLDQQFAAVAIEQKLRFTVRPSSVLVHTDRSLLHSILANFISNALRYTEHGKILVGVRHRGDFVEIQVLDTGIGIAQEHSDLIFREFYQIGNVARRREHGLGLGLAIVKRTADLLGVRVLMHSVPQRGSVFSVCLPIVGASAKPANAVLNVTSMAGSKTVLVVDDDVDVLDSMRALLSAWGHQVIAAGGLDEALMLAQHHVKNGPAFDMILSDFRLAENTSGIDVVRAVRQVCGSEIPAVIITGDTSTESINQIVASRLKILHKPLDADVLQNVLRELS
ncbi:signal transduction histidine kinase [Herminiimonas fonticola]|uniref:histidine kinase n=2 Tax=Herminiimonas fonticola TaxID=303380 RepID=A0A4R6GHA4_9BURK|nr:Histidine kinase-, DNA gyrase B-, and HSP90-like ATPase [Herminiimonas fonticola]TDN94351.1 signal transduction histidine kinase [Herminiimonas fonticola]